MTRDEFQALLDRAAAGWADGDAAAVGDCFAEDVEYLDPFLYRFDRRADLLPFFEPPPGGHRVTWHSVIWDDEAQTAAVEYSYEGHHRYHGAAIVRPGRGRPDRPLARVAASRRRPGLGLADRRARRPTTRCSPRSTTSSSACRPAARTPPAPSTAASWACARSPSRAELAGRGGVWFAGRAVAIHLGVEADFRPAPKAHPGLRRRRPRRGARALLDGRRHRDGR